MHLTANTGSKVEITKDGVKYLFRVMGCGDQAHGLVKPHTVLYTEGEPFDDEDSNDFDNKKYWFDQIVGCEKAKSQIKNLAECYLDGKKIQGVKETRGLILAGPEGVGKTLLSLSLGGELNRATFYRSGADLRQKRQAQFLKKIINEYEQSSVLLLIQNFDELFSQANDGIAETYKFISFWGKKIFIIATTRNLSAIDPEFLEQGLLETTIQLELPNHQERKQMFHRGLLKASLEFQIPLEPFAAKSEGFSGKQIAEICAKAREVAKAESSEKLHQRHLVRSFELYSEAKRNK